MTEQDAGRALDEPRNEDGETRAEFEAATRDAETARDSWAPINRRGEPVRNEIDWFRNTRVAVPTTLDAAFAALALALEWFETCVEVERDTHEAHAAHMVDEPEMRETVVGYLLDADEKAKVTPETRAAALAMTGGRSASSRTAAEKLVDLVPAVVRFNADARRLHRAKLDAEKETSVARRRHDTLKIIADRMPHVTVEYTVADHGLAPSPMPPRVERDIDGAAATVGNRGGWKPAYIAEGDTRTAGITAPEAGQ